MVTTAPSIIRGEGGPGAQAPPATTPAPGRPIRTRYRDFSVYAHDELVGGRAGYGVTLADVVDEQEERYGRQLAAAIGPDGELPESFDEDFPDRVVWDRGRVVAVLRPCADGGFDVVRLDRLSVARRGGAR